MNTFDRMHIWSKCTHFYICLKCNYTVPVGTTQGELKYLTCEDFCESETGKEIIKGEKE